MRRLLITADDYGFTAGVNSGIEACVRAGSVRSVCVMPNMPYRKRAACLREIDPSVSIGVHWTVTQGKPLLAPGSLRSLVDPEGNFHSRDTFRRNAYAGRINFHELEMELAAQYEELRGIVPWLEYWNSHHGVHVHPRLYWSFLRVAQRFRIPGMRSHDRILARGQTNALLYLATHPGFTAKAMVVSAMSATARAKGFGMPAGLLVDPGPGPGHSRVTELVRGGRWVGVAEIAIHPASDVGGLTGQSSMRESRLAEFKTFSSVDLLRELHDAGVEPVNFDVVLQD